MKWYAQNEQAVAAALQTDLEHGLTWKEAEQRLERYGPNQLVDQANISAFALLLNQFKDFMVLILLIATLISGILGEYTDAITIIAIVILNAILGFIQEYKAEKSLQALKELSAPLAHVIREGELAEIPAAELVPGDIIFFEAGDRIAADTRLFDVKGMYVEESALTGESIPVPKETGILPNEAINLGDQFNMCFKGTLVTRGAGQGIVVNTGMNTEMGQIAELLQTQESMQTPLQQRLEQLGKILISVAIILTIAVVVTGIWHGQNVYDMFLAGVSLAVAAIPEGLPAIVTIALALGVQRMIRRKAIVRKLPSVETLGCASVICSDKTGTLTQNKMTVTRLWVNDELIHVTGGGYDPQGSFFQAEKQLSFHQKPYVKKMLEYGVLCTNAVLQKENEREEGFFKKKNAYWDIMGDPTEGALVVAGAKAGLWKKELDAAYPRLEEFPFDSSRKMMSVVVSNRFGERRVITKGAPDVLLEKCSHVFWKGKVRLLTLDIKQKILRANERLADEALRNIGIAYKEIKNGGQIPTEQEAERHLIFLGLFGMMDPPRDEVKQAILECKQAGIKTIMITGDHQKTAEAIALQLGILAKDEHTLNGKQLQMMDDREFANLVEKVSVYARVSPEHKLRIVKALQEKGHVVAMTGDGVNDAPAIKAADIGIAMGIMGTDVAKEASALVLSDDNFSTIKAAIEEGRNIYENIRKFIRYILASNVGEILVMFLAMLAGLPLPLVPIQILWVNLVTDGFPALALGVDRMESKVMKQPPRNRKESIFARGLAWKIVSRGFLIGLATLVAFWLTLEQNPDNLTKAQTIAFATLVMAQLIHVFDCRSEISIFNRNPFENIWLLIAVFVSALMLIGVIYIESLQPIFKTTALDLKDWLFLLFFACLPSVALGFSHLFRRKKYLF